MLRSRDIAHGMQMLEFPALFHGCITLLLLYLHDMSVGSLRLLHSSMHYRFQGTAFPQLLRLINLATVPTMVFSSFVQRIDRRH